MDQIINNIIKKIFPFVMLILYSSFAAASSTDIVSDESSISLTIVNRPPAITAIYFNPETTFEDDKLECIAAVNDENVDETTLIYKWYVNNEVIETSNNYLTGFNENDLIRCEVTPIDNENVIGETKNITTTINKKPFLSAITGFVIKNYNTNISLSLTLFLNFAAIIAIFIIIFFKVLDINILTRKVLNCK